MRGFRMTLAGVVALAAATVANSGWHAPAQGAVVPDPFLGVEFPADRTVNPDFEPYTITIDDRRGSGTLYAQFGNGVREEIPHQGSADLSIPIQWGKGEVVIIRCTTGLTGNVNCVDTGHQSPTIVVRRRLNVSDANVAGDMVSPNGDGVKDTLQAQMYVDDLHQPVWVTWSYRDTSGDPIAVIGGPVTATPNADGRVSIPMEPADVPSGTYELSFTLRADTPDFGPLEGTIPGSIDTTIIVDLEPPGPVGFTIDNPTIYPYIEGMWSPAYPLTTEIYVSAPDQHLGEGSIEMLDSAGTPVLSVAASFLGWSRFEWDGRDDDGERVPPGRYQMRIEHTDRAGNTTAALGPTVEVRGERLVRHSLTRVLTPSRALVDQTAGRCSELRRPSSRGWPGSLGLYSNVRCDTSKRASLVRVSYRVAVPTRAVQLGALTVTGVGGAARWAPRSTATVAFRASDGWGFPQALGSRLGSHETHLYRPQFFTYNDRITFSVSVEGGNQYDLKRIEVRLNSLVVE